jgi:hypothetical protein
MDLCNNQQQPIIHYLRIYTLIPSHIFILDTQGLQSPASRTGFSSPLDLTVANSAPGHCPCYWAYSPCADHHKLLLVKLCFFCNKFVNILNTQVLSHSAWWTRLLRPLKSNHHLRQWSVFIWRNSQRVDSTFHTQTCICAVRSLNKLFLNLTRVQIIKCKRTGTDLDAGVWMYWRGMEIPIPDILAWGLFTSGSSRAVISLFLSRILREVDLARC